MSAAPASTAAGIEAADDGRLYRRLWRWHFYAAFLVIPFVLLQSITGTLYLWHDEWADWAHPELRFVEPQAQRASLDTLVAAASAAHPHAQATTLIVPDDAHRAAQVMFGGHHGESEALPFPVFLNPYSGEVLGQLPGWSWMPGWSREIHGGWPLGDAGSWLLELGACWAVVMVLTGLYLWWPRDRGLMASLVPRLGQGSRVLVRDLHASVAVLFSGLLLVFLVSALPWTHFWGNQVLKPLQNVIGQTSPFGAAMRARSSAQAGGETLSLDQALSRAREAGVSGDVEIKLDGKPGSALSLRNRQPRAAQETQLALDRGNGAVLVKTTWEDYPPIPRAVSVGVDLHEGTFFGRANQWFNTMFALALVWISATGFLSWWLRRPRGKLGAPLRTEIRLPRWALATGVGLCVVMPLLGASVLALWMCDRVGAGAWLARS